MKTYLLTITALLFASISMATTIEEPKWQSIVTLDKVELRQYAPSVQAQTTLTADEGTSAGFRRLAGFIFGGNDRAQKIAMTAPVENTRRDSVSVMAFTMPAQYAAGNLPSPNDDRVTIIELPARSLAVISFSGWATPDKVEQNKAQLLATLERHNIVPVGSISLNQYDPPWTLPFLRRNELAVEIAGAELAKLP